MADPRDPTPETRRDREALEQIVGRPLDAEPWPDGAWPVGTRVRVVVDPELGGPWAQEFEGAVDDTAAPTRWKASTARPGELAYFVVFDEPQRDRGGDGPYR